MSATSVNESAAITVKNGKLKATSNPYCFTYCESEPCQGIKDVITSNVLNNTDPNTQIYRSTNVFVGETLYYNNLPFIIIETIPQSHIERENLVNLCKQILNRNLKTFMIKTMYTTINTSISCHGKCKECGQLSNVYCTNCNAEICSNNCHLKHKCN